jgi:hypothetical protein
MEDNRLPKQLVNYHPKGRRRPGRPRKRLLDDMTAETETGHPGLNSWWNMMLMMIIVIWSSVFWDILPYSQIDVDRRFRDTCCLHHQGALMMEAARTSETSVDIYLTAWQYIAVDWTSCSPPWEPEFSHDDILLLTHNVCCVLLPVSYRVIELTCCSHRWPLFLL